MQEFIEFYRNRVQGIHEFKPHHGYYILSDWERKGYVKQIITQNVDGFHEEAGNQKVAELHGTLKRFIVKYVEGAILVMNIYMTTIHAVVEEY